ncbi:MAG: DNA alkylation repair enzyme [bacterium ADurb.Bin212]|nr:MAG: DNA alkylation repair enzyme [bacterium ADurb.Bin212]
MNVTDIQKMIHNASAPCKDIEAEWVQKYLGTKRKFIGLKSPDRNKVLNLVAHDLKKREAAEVKAILDQLFASDIFDDYNFAGKLLTRLPQVRKSLKMSRIKSWLQNSNGWAECDSICQSLFDFKEVLERWTEFENIINECRISKNIQLRRASLVLQVKPNRNCADPKLRHLAFETIEKLKSEKDILITKAVSWLLREMSRLSSHEVKEYLERNKDSLPAIAYRETMKKIETGKK